MKPLIIQITKGVTMARFTTISAMPRVQQVAACRNIRKNGSTITTAGMNWVERIKKNRNLRPRIRKREKE